MTDDMDLPAGKTCGDCAGWLRCRAFIGSLKPTNTRCDWAPSAFREVWVHPLDRAKLAHYIKRLNERRDRERSVPPASPP